MANVLTKTEQLDDAIWSKNGGATVTANSASAPAFAGASAGLADTVNDPTAADTSDIRQSASKSTGDVGNWVGSWYVRKDSDTTRFPVFLVEFFGVATFTRGFMFDTSTGATTASSAFTVPSSFGVDSIDANWWRVWAVVADASANDNVRIIMFPALTSSWGGGFNSPTTGSIILWGANLMQGSAVGTYEPDPFYAFEVDPLTLPFRTKMSVLRL